MSRDRNLAQVLERMSKLDSRKLGKELRRYRRLCKEAETKWKRTAGDKRQK